MNPTSPMTGSAQTGLTGPTYTLTDDVGPNASSEQWAVTSLGGTQTGVEVHSVSNPFTLTVERPSNFKQLGKANPVTGVVASVPRNVHTVRVRKGVSVLSTQPVVPALVECKVHVPAGSDTEDPESVRAMLSLMIGALSDLSSDIGDLAITGVL